MISQCTKFEVSRLRYEAMNGGAKCKKWGGLGHSKSWAMPLFDRAHTTSCLTLIVTMRLSCTVFEQYRTVWRERFGAAVLARPFWHGDGLAQVVLARGSYNFFEPSA